MTNTQKVTLKFKFKKYRHYILIFGKKNDLILNFCNN